jgi:hypothetical protein
MVDFDGKNRFPQDEPWLTDGYGDYIRHFLRAMDAVPSLTAPGEDHIISSTSVIQQADYRGHLKKFIYLSFDGVDSASVVLFYRAFDVSGVEKIRLRAKPSGVLVDGRSLVETAAGEGYSWTPFKSGGGLLVVRRELGRKVLVISRRAPLKRISLFLLRPEAAHRVGECRGHRFVGNGNGRDQE